MDDNHKFGVEKMCQAFKVSRSGYYEWLGREPSRRSIERTEVTRQIKDYIRVVKAGMGVQRLPMSCMILAG